MVHILLLRHLFSPLPPLTLSLSLPLPLSYRPGGERTAGRGERDACVPSVYKAQTNFSVIPARESIERRENCRAANRTRKGAGFEKCPRNVSDTRGLVANANLNARARSRGCNRRLQTITRGILVPLTHTHIHVRAREACENTSSRRANSERVNLLLYSLQYTGCSEHLSLSVSRPRNSLASLILHEFFHDFPTVGYHLIVTQVMNATRVSHQIFYLPAYCCNYFNNFTSSLNRDSQFNFLGEKSAREITSVFIWREC